jgi:hypothetical protein
MLELSIFDPHSLMDLKEVLLGDGVSATTFFAQNFKQFDVMADMQNAFQNFVESGQVWALLIGIFFGYLFKSLTSY